MRRVSWHNYGYGVCVSEIEPVSVESLEHLLSCAPKFHALVKKWFADCCISEPTYEDYVEFDQDYMLGLATLLSRVIEETEGVCFTACDNYDDNDYLIYQPSYPWQISEKEQDLTEEKIAQILAKYIRMLTEKEITIDYQEVENGG